MTKLQAVRIQSSNPGRDKIFLHLWKNLAWLWDPPSPLCRWFFSCRHVWHNSVLTDILPSKKKKFKFEEHVFSVYKLATCTWQNDSRSVSGRRSQFYVLDRLALGGIALWLSRTHGAHHLELAYAPSSGCGISIVKCSLIVTIEQWW